MKSKQLYAIDNKNKAIILKLCPNATNDSGIYIFTREENDFKYFYVGQAKRLLERLVSHLRGYQHIDLSIRKHKLWSETNPTGWKVGILFFSESELNEKEQYYIKLYISKGYVTRNYTAGSQGDGKHSIGEQKAPKGYRQGIEQGYKNAQKEIAKLFEKHLAVVYKNVDVQNGDKPPKLIEQNAMNKFMDFITIENKEENE